MKKGDRPNGRRPFSIHAHNIIKTENNQPYPHLRNFLICKILYCWSPRARDF